MSCYNLDFIFSHDKNKEKIKKTLASTGTLFRQSKQKFTLTCLCEVPEPTKLGYKLDNKMHQLFEKFIYPAWYLSLVGSGTLQSTRAHQARVLIWINKFEKELMQLSSILFYPAWYSSLVGSGTL